MQQRMNMICAEFSALGFECRIISEISFTARFVGWSPVVTNDPYEFCDQEKEQYHVIISDVTAKNTHIIYNELQKSPITSKVCVIASSMGMRLTTFHRGLGDVDTILGTFLKIMKCAMVVWDETATASPESIHQLTYMERKKKTMRYANYNSTATYHKSDRVLYEMLDTREVNKLRRRLTRHPWALLNNNCDIEFDLARIKDPTTINFPTLPRVRYETEKEFGQDVSRCLQSQGNELWFEVKPRIGHLSILVDVVMRRGVEWYTIELKTHMSEAVLQQAMRHNVLCNLSHYACIAVPSVRKLSFAHLVYAQYYGIGIWSFEKTKTSEMSYIELLAPRRNIHASDPPAVSRFVKDFSKNNNPGSVSGGAVTPFKHSCHRILEYCVKSGETSRKKIWEALHDELHWASYHGMTSALSTLKKVECVARIHACIQKNKENQATK